MAAWRYETSLLVLKKYFTRSLRSLVKYFSTLEEEFRISTRPCNILYVYYPQTHMQIFTPTVVQGGGGGLIEPSLGFWYVAIFQNDFAFCGKSLIFSTRWGIFYGWWRC